MKGRRKAIAVLVAVLMAVPLAVWASDRFEDVPDSNVFHDDISWLADSGVTFGCNPPENTQFCPSDNVTREQMAAFMRRLSEGQVVDAATAIEADHASDAATLDGRPSEVYLTTVGYDSCGLDATFATDCPSAPGSTVLEVLTATVDAPGPGLVRLNSHWQTTTNAMMWFSSEAACNLSDFQEQVSDTGGQFSIPDTSQFNNVSFGGHVEVAAGTTEIRLCAYSAAALQPQFADLSAEFSLASSTSINANTAEAHPADLPVDLSEFGID
ncbi:MAG: hypothetical protein GEU79_14790 [Acidimicrobiia bacterium]|nr:hypothetical protein [Acidimicrobiia bacterium]